MRFLICLYSESSREEKNERNRAIWQTWNSQKEPAGNVWALSHAFRLIRDGTTLHPGLSNPLPAVMPSTWMHWPRLIINRTPPFFFVPITVREVSFTLSSFLHTHSVSHSPSLILQKKRMRKCNAWCFELPILYGTILHSFCSLRCYGF